MAGVRKVRNPITLARAVMENSGFVLLCGDGAETFAREQGIPFEEAAYFATEARWRQLVAAREKASVVMDHDPAEVKFGTVGAVALDLEGNLAAATSTGGPSPTKDMVASAIAPSSVAALTPIIAHAPSLAPATARSSSVPPWPAMSPREWKCSARPSISPQRRSFMNGSSK